MLFCIIYMEILERYVNNFGTIPLDYSQIILHDKIYYLTTFNTKELAKKIPEEFFSIGIPLAKVDKGFHATQNLLELIAPHTDHKIIIDEKTAQLFTCGRDIFIDSVLDIENRTAELYIVCTEKNEVLGLVKKTREKVAGKQKTVFKNLLDIGILLRREQKKKKTQSKKN